MHPPHLRQIAAVALLLLGVLTMPSLGQVPHALLHSIPPANVEMQTSTHLGASVAVDEGSGLTVAGIPFHDLGSEDSGLVKVFDSATGALLHTIPNPTPGYEDYFGDSVAISGNLVVVGSYGDATGATNAGSAYVYDLAGETPTVPIVTLNNPSPASYYNFGNSVAISGSRIAVGASGDNTNGGSVFVFDLTSGTPTIPLATLQNPDSTNYGHYGCSVAISGMRVAVGDCRRHTEAAAFAGTAYVFDLDSSTPLVPVVTLIKPDAETGDYFGYSVSISGARLVVGAHETGMGANGAGSAYVYDLNSITPTVPVATLKNPAPASHDNFGYSVAISGTRVVIGAFQDDTGATNAGSAYVYDLASGTSTVPVLALNKTSPVSYDNFGASVAISGTQVVVGATGDDTGATDAGSAYVYVLSGGTPSVPIATLNSPSPVEGDLFGTSLAISGTRVVVGAYLDDTRAKDAGSVYVYDVASATPTVPVLTLNSPNSSFLENFGWSVAISGKRVVVGTKNTPCVYVYDLDNVRPTAPAVILAGNKSFGESVAISGTRVVVGVYDENFWAQESGVVYIYDVENGKKLVAMLTKPEPAAYDFFGESVAISGALVVVGARRDDTGATDAGSAYVYDLNSTTPTVPVVALYNPDPAVNDYFGCSVAISGTQVVVGAYRDDTGATNAGSAYVYDLTSGTPTVPKAILNNPNPASNDYFGETVAISGGRVVVGARLNDTVAINAGSAYVYDLNSTTPTVPVAALNNPTPVSADYFGSSVAVDAAIVIGAPNDDTMGRDNGYAYVFGPTTALPSLIVTGNEQKIDHEDTTPTPADHTYFSKLSVAGTSAKRTFTIKNTGSSVLNLTGRPYVKLKGSSAFRVTRQPASAMVSPYGGTSTFEITFAPTVAGYHTAKVSIASDDADGTPFIFDVAGVRVVPGQKPTLKLTAPLANALVSAPLPLLVGGTTGDTEGVDRVEIVLNGGAPVLATLGASTKPTAVPFSAFIPPLPGANTLVVSAYNLMGNATSVTRSFTFEQRFVLSVARGVPVAQGATPDKAGTVSMKAAPAGKASALSKGNPQTSAVLPGTLLTVIAVAKSGHLFSHWTGLPAGALVNGNVVSFPMPVADVPRLMAVFVENALAQDDFIPLTAKPVFQGLLRPAGATVAGNNTVGFLQAALVRASGALSGRVWMDGKVTPFSGVAHGDGTVWFRVGRTLLPKLLLLGRELGMTWSGNGLALTVTGGAGEVSTGLARPRLYTMDNPVRPALLDAKGKQGFYTLALTTVAQDPVKPLTEYPQGSGRAGLTLQSNGSLRLTGTLAEGTGVTASGFLAAGDEADLFIALPTPGSKTKHGSLLGTLVFDETQPGSDVTSTDLTWFRPVAETAATKTQAYRAGWPGGIALGLTGTRYDKTANAQTTLGLAGPGQMFFSYGKLPAPVLLENFILNGNSVNKTLVQDQGFSLSFTQGTGFFRGSFTPGGISGRLHSFQGVLLQKGADRGGWGWFLSNQTADLDPESGSVTFGAP